MDSLSNLYEIFKSSKDGRWICGLNDCENVYRIINENQFTSVLELGTGIGALTAAAALAVGEYGHVDTVDNVQKCLDIAKLLIPKELQERITFHQRDVKVTFMKEIMYQHFEVYKDLPLDGKEYELVIIDGPGPVLEDDKLVDLPAGDFIDILTRTQHGTFLYIDGRRQMLTLMLRYFSGHFLPIDVRGDSALLMRVNSTKDGVHFHDTKLEMYKQQGLFS